MTATVALTGSHPNGAYINLNIDRGDLVPGAYCAPPGELPPASTSATFGLSSAVVSSPTPVHVFTDLSYSGASGVAHDLVNVPVVVTLNPGGTEPPPPLLASLTVSPSIIAAAGEALVDVTLTKMAPARGVNISLSSSKPSVASMIPNPQIQVLGRCTEANGSGSFAVQAANSVPQQTTVTISASDGAAGQAPLTQLLTVTPGCVPVACSGGPSCGPQPDGCGGTENCGCTNTTTFTAGTVNAQTCSDVDTKTNSTG